jgi:hypothetical protein
LNQVGDIHEPEIPFFNRKGWSTKLNVELFENFWKLPAITDMILPLEDTHAGVKNIELAH